MCLTLWLLHCFNTILLSSGEAHVTACEVYPPMVKLAKQLIACNNLTGSVNIYQKRSDELIVCQDDSRSSDSSAHSDHASATCSILHQAAPPGQSEKVQPNLTSTAAKRKKHVKRLGGDAVVPRSADMPSKADVIVTEIFDSELLGEGILPTMQHAVKHLLQVCGHPVLLAVYVIGLMQALQCQAKVYWFSCCCECPDGICGILHLQSCVLHIYNTAVWACMFILACAHPMQHTTQPLQ